MTSSTPARLLVGLVAALSLGASVWAQRADVLPASRRQATVELAASIADRTPAGPLAADLNNPFFPNSFKPKKQPVSSTAAAGPVAPVASGPSSNYELLETIAPELTPSGTMTLGGEPLLLFGQKKIRVGGELPIIYEGKRYTLVVSAIETSFFTLRLGDAEYTRPIKP